MTKSKEKKPGANKGRDGKSSSSQPVGVPAPPPSWPVFKPPLPVVDLTLETLIPGKVVVIKTFWPRSLCLDYTAFLAGLPLTTTPGKPKRGEATRVNDRYQIDDPIFANRLWIETGLQDALCSEDTAGLW